jgi:hypothetical protein
MLASSQSGGDATADQVVDLRLVDSTAPRVRQSLAEFLVLIRERENG